VDTNISEELVTSIFKTQDSGMKMYQQILMKHQYHEIYIYIYRERERERERERASD
jgi:hypothetical protein